MCDAGSAGEVARSAGVARAWRGRGAGAQVVSRVLDELDEGDEQTPRVRTMHDEPLDEHARYLLLDALVRRLREANSNLDAGGHMGYAASL